MRSSTPPPLILASSSPRRAGYLRELGFAFRRVVPDIDERTRRGESPRRYVRRLAESKALVVARRYPQDWVVAADTTIVLDGRILGKPRSERDARRMLRLLSGRSHQVLSALALVRARSGFLRCGVSTTRVVFQPLTNGEIRSYVETGEPMGKAGAYGIQGKGAFLVTRIEGSFSNVAGFPLEKFFELWTAASLPLPWERVRPESASS